MYKGIIRKRFKLRHGRLSRAHREVTPLMRAAGAGDAARVRSLLLHGASAMVNDWDADGMTALRYAAQGKLRLPVIRLLLQHGAAVNAQNDVGVTVLVDAAHARNLAMVRLLLRKGADPNLPTSAISCLRAAVHYWLFGFKDCADITLALLAAGAVPNEGRPFLEAAEFGNTTILKTLLAYGADVNAVDENGRTALMWAICGGSDHFKEAVRVLLEAGADAGPVDSDGYTALAYAECRQREALEHYPDEADRWSRTLELLRMPAHP